MHWRQDWLPRSAKPELGKLVDPKHVEASGESKLDNNMPMFKINLAGNPNSCIIKINRKTFHALLSITYAYKDI